MTEKRTDILDLLTQKRTLLVIIVVIAAILRLYHYTANPLWIDEAWTLYVAQHGWITGIFLDVHPPLHYWLVKAAISVFGTSEAVIRMPSLVFGIIGVALIYFFSHQFTKNDWAGLVSAGLLAVSYDHIFRSQDARNYTLWLCVFMIFGILYLMAIERPWDVKLWIYTGISAGVLMWTHYWSVFPLVILGAYALWKNRSALKPVAYGFAAFIILFIPLIPVFINSITIKGAEGWTIFEPWNVIIQDTWLMFSNYNVILAIIFFILMGLGFMTAIYRSELRTNFTIAAILMIGTVAVFLATSPWFMTIPKYAIYLVPFIYSLIGLGVCVVLAPYQSHKRMIFVASLMVLMVLAAIPLEGYYAQTNRDGWYDHNDELTNVTHGKPVAIIANPGLAMQWAYYYNGTVIPFRSDEELNEITGRYPYGVFVFVPASEIPPDLPEAQQIDQHLRKNGVLIGDYRGFRGWFVNG